MEILWLRKNENPPSDTQCIVITRDSKGADISEGSVVRHEGGATFYVPFDATKQQLDNIVHDASDWGVMTGIERIYIQE